MIPRVYPGQHLPPGNSDLVINGPATGWEPDELAAFVTFVVTQNGSVPATVGIGETTLLKRRSDGGDFDWSAAVTRVSGPQFKTGPVYGNKPAAEHHFDALKRMLDRKEPDYLD